MTINLHTVLILAAVLFMGILLGILLNRIVGTRILGSASKRKSSQELRDRKHAMAVYQLVSTLSATLNYQRVLETALDMGSRVLSDGDDPNDRLVSAFFLFTADEKDPAQMVLKVGSARRFTPSDLRIQLDGHQGLLAETIEGGELKTGKNLAQDPELGKIVSLRTCRSALCLPLRTGLDTYGVLLFAHPAANYFDSETQELLEIIAHQAMIALQNARLYRDLEQEKERMAEIQEEARKKLARDLHDGPTQSVAAIAMRINFARRLIERDREAALQEMLKIEDLARRTTKEIRHMLFTLRPLVLESKGLIAALEAMAEKMADTYHQRVTIEAEPLVLEKIGLGKQAVMFYIAEEAVNNARKHAEAANIWIRLKLVNPDLALLAIEDDGVGFDVGAVDAAYENRGSLGMINMRERAELINGVLRIDSSEGKGTRIHVALPLTDAALERLQNRQVF